MSAPSLPEIYEPPPTLVTLEDAEGALKIIAVAEAAEKLFKRAKDAKGLYAAIKEKLRHQAAYAACRHDIVVHGGDRKSRSQPHDLDRPAGDPGKDIIARWRERFCKKIEANLWEVDHKKFAITLEDTQKYCVRICEQQNLGTIRGTEGTGEFERYTPTEYIEAARQVLGEIDLDPASSELAQETVRATECFTAEDDGLEREWHGRVWLNPPYHRELAPKFIDKLVAEIAAGRVDEAIVLTNNSTDTQWFRAAADVCDAICFVTGRIRFEVPNANPVLPTQGQAFFYFGVNTKRFVRVFKAIGFCVKVI